MRAWTSFVQAFLLLNDVNRYLSLIKFSHTIFALPFALIGFIIGTSHAGGFDSTILILVLMCMIFARSAAMAFNRYIDRQIDSRNPRTSNREIPAGIIKPRHALFFVIGMSICFVISAGLINSLCLYLSPIVLFVIFIYSYSKRFTALCHVILGIGLGLAPIGAYVAVTNAFSIPVILIGFAVVFWVAGFDIIYALQDDEFDKSEKLHSLPVFLGRRRALGLSRVFHVITAAFLILAAVLLTESVDWISWISSVGVLFFIASLIYQHQLISEDNLTKIDRAFFTTNGLASLIFGSLILIDFFI